MATANLKAKISLDSSAFSRGIRNVRTQLNSIAGSIGKVSGFAAKAGLALAGIGAIALAKGVKDALDLGSSLTELSARTGAPIRDLVILQQAFKDAGVGAEAVGPAINKLQKALTGVNEQGEPTNKFFEKLGLNMDELKSLTPEEQFKKVGQAISALPSPAERAAAAMGIFGKSGGEMLALFSDPAAFGNAAQMVGSQADILAKNAEKFDKVSDIFNGIGTKFQGFFVGVAESLLPALTKAAEFLASLDLAPIGQRFGNAIATGINILVNAFAQGKIGELVELGLTVAFTNAVNYLLGGIRTVIEILGASIGRIFSGDVFASIVVGFAGVGKKISAFLIEAFQVPISHLIAGLTFAAQEFAKGLLKSINPVLGALGAKVIESFGGNMSFQEHLAGAQSLFNSDTARNLNAEGDTLLKESGGGLANVATDIATIIAEKIKAFAPSDLLDAEGATAKMKALADSLNVPLEKVQEVAKQTTQQSQGLQQASSLGKFANTDGDRLARIGGFVGGGASAAISFARKTADNTAIIAKHIVKMAGGTGAVDGGSTWAEG